MPTGRQRPPAASIHAGNRSFTVAAPQNIIAVVFDYDDTLTDDSTTKLLDSHGIDTRDFWQNKMKTLTDAGWDATLAYLKLILDETQPGRPLENLSNAKLAEFGASLDFYHGIPGLFTDLQELMKKHEASRPSIEFYIISGGLEEIVKGSKIAQYFSGIWGCRFAEDGGRIKHIMNAISYTEKTKHLFAINKGVERITRKQPYAVNRKIEQADRRIPFSNMIYVGDGLTDVPCFSLMHQFHGWPFGVFDPGKDDSPRKAWEQLVSPRRTITMNAPRYGKKDELGALLRTAVTSICLALDTRTGAALG
jgi:phosphoglycolate phosphatase-like HAD superfamily hydrolase